MAQGGGAGSTVSFPVHRDAFLPAWPARVLEGCHHALSFPEDQPPWMEPPGTGSPGHFLSLSLLRVPGGR